MHGDHAVMTLYITDITLKKKKKKKKKEEEEEEEEEISHIMTVSLPI